jgi:hypothetical protein
VKKLVVLFLTIIFLFSLSSCKVYKLPWDQFCATVENPREVELDYEDRKYIIDIFNSGRWRLDNSKFASDFMFYPQAQEVGYHSECGIFNDYTRKRYLKVSEEQRQKINDILGLNYTKDK